MRTRLIPVLVLAMAVPAAAQMFDDFVLPTGGGKAPAGAPPFVIADFDQGKCALKDGSPFLAAAGAKVEARPEDKIRHLGKGQSMKVSYELGADQPAVLRVDLKGLDASRRRSLVLQVFGAKEGTPGEIEIVLRSASEEGHARIKGLSPYFWSRQAIAFEKFGLKDTSRLTALEIAIPKDSKPAKGAFFVDSIAFE